MVFQEFSMEDHAYGMRVAIFKRRSVRSYSPRQVDQNTVRTLLDAAVQAPTAMHLEPWAFAVVQERSLLDRLSESAKEAVRREGERNGSLHSREVLAFVNQPDFHVFYNAGMLIVIYGRFKGDFVVADCWLAAENLLLAACATGLGTCVIGFAVSALNAPEWKEELNIPHEMTAIAPIILGFPAGEMQAVSRKQPEIITWK